MNDNECSHEWDRRDTGISICLKCKLAAFNCAIEDEVFTSTKEDLNTLCFAAMRYALGRKTYVVEMVCEALLNNKDKLRTDIKNRMINEIREAIDSNEAGMSYDKQLWNKVMNELL
jgi:hypothetical protein